MKKIIAFTDSITTCECCGKSGLKGTYCVEIDGVELYYGSTCAKKEHGITDEAQKEAIVSFKAEIKKEKALQSLSEMAVEAKGNFFKERKVVAFIKKQGLDLISFIEKNARMTEDTKFYISYEYGSDSYIHTK
jgi:hypothetical protein